MSQSELVKKIAQVFKDAGIPYMLTGSIVSSLQGAPRATEDVDLVAALQPLHVPILVKAFCPPSYYLSEDAIKDALQRKSMFNIIGMTDDFKADVWILKDETYAQTCFERRKAANALGTSLMVSTPEDTILSKLRWAVLCGGSDKQYGDALRVYEVQYHKLDNAYLDNWAVKLNVSDMLKRIRDEAKPVG
jgi:hypothetical protein